MPDTSRGKPRTASASQSSNASVKKELPGIYIMERKAVLIGRKRLRMPHDQLPPALDLKRLHPRSLDIKTLVKLGVSGFEFGNKSLIFSRAPPEKVPLDYCVVMKPDTQRPNVFHLVIRSNPSECEVVSFKTRDAPDAREILTVFAHVKEDAREKQERQSVAHVPTTLIRNRFSPTSNNNNVDKTNWRLQNEEGSHSELAAPRAHNLHELGQKNGVSMHKIVEAREMRHHHRDLRRNSLDENIVNASGIEANNNYLPNGDASTHHHNERMDDSRLGETSNGGIKNQGAAQKYSSHTFHDLRKQGLPGGGTASVDTTVDSEAFDGNSFVSNTFPEQQLARENVELRTQVSRMSNEISRIRRLVETTAVTSVTSDGRERYYSESERSVGQASALVGDYRGSGMSDTSASIRFGESSIYDPPRYLRAHSVNGDHNGGVNYKVANGGRMIDAIEEEDYDIAAEQKRAEMIRNRSRLKSESTLTQSSYVPNTRPQYYIKNQGQSSTQPMVLYEVRTQNPTLTRARHRSKARATTPVPLARYRSNPSLAGTLTRNRALSSSQTALYKINTVQRQPRGDTQL